MNFSKVTKTIKKVTKTLDKHLPAILTGIGAVGSVTGVVLAANAGVKTAPILAERKAIQKKERMTKTQSLVDNVAHVGKYYIPTAVVTAASVACIIGAHKVNTKRIAALSTALIASQDRFKTYKDKVKEVVGEKKEHKIANEAAAEHVNNQLTYLPWDKLIEGEGPVVYCDLNTGKLWKSDPMTMTNCINEFNKKIANNPFDEPITMNEWYDMFEGIKTVPFISTKMYQTKELPDLDRMTTTGPCIGGFAICYLDYDYIVYNG